MLSARRARKSVEGALEIVDQVGKNKIRRRRPRDEHIVAARLSVKGKNDAACLAQAPLDPVAQDRFAEFLGHCNAGANPRFRVLPLPLHE